MHFRDPETNKPISRAFVLGITASTVLFFFAGAAVLGALLWDGYHGRHPDPGARQYILLGVWFAVLVITRLRVIYGRFVKRLSYSIGPFGRPHPDDTHDRMTLASWRARWLADAVGDEPTLMHFMFVAGPNTVSDQIDPVALAAAKAAGEPWAQDIEPGDIAWVLHPEQPLRLLVDSYAAGPSTPMAAALLQQAADLLREHTDTVIARWHKGVEEAAARAAALGTDGAGAGAGEDA